MAPEPEIGKATVEDAVEILALQRLEYQSEAHIYGDWMLPPLIQTLEEILDQIPCFPQSLQRVLDYRISASLHVSLRTKG